jgi:hypothetical protein
VHANGLVGIRPARGELAVLDRATVKRRRCREGMSSPAWVITRNGAVYEVHNDYDSMCGLYGALRTTLLNDGVFHGNGGQLRCDELRGPTMSASVLRGQGARAHVAASTVVACMAFTAC